MFRRRDARPIWQICKELLWPRGGWGRAFGYMAHRVRRLPDTPERIARGVATGVFTTFTPLYGLHFVIAALLARMFSGNILASILATFFGNPLTYVPIAIVSLRTGRFMLGQPGGGKVDSSLGRKFAGAWQDLWHNFTAIFTPARSEWGQLKIFYDDIFLPWLVGGVVPGIIAGVIGYYLSLPVLRAYQKRRQALAQARLAKRAAKAQGQTQI